MPTTTFENINIPRCGIKFIHIFIDDKFVDAFIDLSKTLSDEAEFYVRSDRAKLQYVRNCEDVVVLSNTEELSEVLNRRNAVYFIHFMTVSIQSIIVNKEMHSYVVWVVWGADLYRMIDFNLYDDKTKMVVEDDRSNKQVNIIKEFIRKRARKARNAKLLLKLDRVMHYNVFEMELLTQVYGKNVPKMSTFFYPNLLLRHDALGLPGSTLCKSSNGLRVVLGNSADPANNHIDAINKLAKLHRISEIVCPLSYGDTRYASSVVEMGTKTLGPKFRPILEYLSIDEYAEMIKGVDFAVYPSNRSMAMGNISFLISNKIPIIMKRNNVGRQYLSSIGIQTIDYQTSTDDWIEKLIDIDIESNKAIVDETFSYSRCANNVSSIYDTYNR